jgi:membrane-bound ClpP family serine protease
MSHIMINVFWICMLLGFIWLVVMAFLSDFGHDFGHVDVDPGGVDVNLDGAHFDHADVYGAGEVQLSPVSPMVLSAFITIFGASGVIMNNLKMTGIKVPLIALGIGILGGMLVWFVLRAIIRAVSGSSEARVAQLIGQEAEVITPIRGSGFGEIAYVAGGSRYNSRAASMDKSDIERSKIVKIVRIVGTTYYVQELTEEELKKQQVIGHDE